MTLQAIVDRLREILDDDDFDGPARRDLMIERLILDIEIAERRERESHAVDA
jgi:hypothetical protein